MSKVVETKKVVTKKGAKGTNPALEAKIQIREAIEELFLPQDGVEVIDGASMFGMTAETLVIRLANTDVQVKLITPAAKLKGRYQELTGE